jgi:hypothetical protein
VFGYDQSLPLISVQKTVISDVEGVEYSSSN